MLSRQGGFNLEIKCPCARKTWHERGRGRIFEVGLFSRDYGINFCHHVILFAITCASRTSFLARNCEQKMVVLSIQVCIRPKVVKDWGLHPII